MPPRYAYWTILIDDKPTAFRAREQAELLPTLQQLKRTNPNALMKWFARGKLWDTPEQAQWASRNLPKQSERRGRDWRPGGSHRDERARFQKRPDRPAKDARSPSPPKFEKRPFAERPTERHRRPDERPRWSGKPTGGKPTGWQPTGGKPTGWKPTGGKPTGWQPTGRKPTGWQPTGGKPTGWKPTGGKPTGWKPTGGKPIGTSTGRKPTGRPTGAKPAGMKFRKPWRKDERPAKGDERKRRDDTFEKPPLESGTKPRSPERE